MDDDEVVLALPFDFLDRNFSKSLNVNISRLNEWLSFLNIQIYKFDIFDSISIQ